MAGLSYQHVVYIPCNCAIESASLHKVLLKRIQDKHQKAMGPTTQRCHRIVLILLLIIVGGAHAWNDTCACNLTVAVCTNTQTKYGSTGDNRTAKCYIPLGVCFCPVEEGNLTVTIPPGSSFGMFLPNAGYADAGCFKFYGGLPSGVVQVIGLGIVTGPVGSMVGNQPLNWNGNAYGANYWTIDNSIGGQITAMCTVKPCPSTDPYSRPGSGHFLQLTNTLAVAQTVDMNIHIGVAASPDSSCHCSAGMQTAAMCMGPWEPHPGYHPPMAHCHNLFIGNVGSDPAYCQCDDGWGSGIIHCGGSCTDGIRNFDETGVDCGGTQCSPCPDTTTTTPTAATSTSPLSTSASATPTTTAVANTSTAATGTTGTSEQRSVSSEGLSLEAGVVTCVWLVYWLGVLLDGGLDAVLRVAV